MTMRKLFLHIGFNKTGSTSLQNDLIDNFSTLKTQGFFYPNDRQRPYVQNVQHVPLAAAIPGRNVLWLQNHKKKTLDQAWENLFEDIRGEEGKTVLLSSESFSERITLPQVRWLREKLTGFDTKIIAYIRRQDTYFLSVYQQSVKGGRTQPFTFEDYTKVNSLYLAERLEVWREIFGHENVIVRPFDPSFWPEGNLLYDFLDQIGAKRDGLETSKPHNESLDYRTVEFRRQLNTFADTLPQPRRVKLTERYAELIGAAEKPQKMLLSTKQTEILREHFRTANKMALEGTDIAPNDFFPPAPKDRPARLIPDSLDAHALLQLLVQKVETKRKMKP